MGDKDIPPVVGIGCSAGGLEAVEAFLASVPTDSGLAFVVIQHLDPLRPSMLPELLQRVTGMPVAEAVDGVAVAAGCVYVIPPNKDLALRDGHLRLAEPLERRGFRLPVDHFLCSLAEDRQEAAIGVVLSGMGSDGVVGLSAIKKAGGLIVVQDPAEAQASGMPESAIATGLVDIIGPAAGLAARIMDLLHHSPQVLGAAGTSPKSAREALAAIVALLRDRSGIDFARYKSGTLLRRIERRLALNQLAGIDDYLGHLRSNPQEIDLLSREILIGVTSFFRDPAVWDQMRDVVLPDLFASHPAGKALRAWVPACSSGEEAYTLAITFREALALHHPPGPFSLQIFATDLDPDAVARGRRGVYPNNIVASVTPERMDRYLVVDDGGFRVGKEIRDMVVFARQNIIADPPFTRLDILCCRNLLIYFRQDLQRRLMPLFHYALVPDGALMLGNAETVGSFEQLFKPVDASSRIFRRRGEPVSVAASGFSGLLADEPSSVVGADNAERGDSIGRLTDLLVQQTYAPAAVLVTAEGDILYISGRTGKYLEPAAGKVNINIHAMAREGLREALVGAIQKAARESVAVRLTGIRVGTNGGTQYVNVTVQGLENPEPLRGRVIVVFEDVPAPAAARHTRNPQAAQGVAELELHQAREAMRIMQEEMQRSLEESQSANEEFQSTNEELQSTNEELTTSKEELQSLNEELQTVNAELQASVSDLIWERDDMTNLLNSTEIATIFLDGAMKLRRFTAHATRLFKLIPGDVGRPLSDLASDLAYPDMLDNARDVLRTLMFHEQQVSTLDERWFRVRIMPYRTQSNMIDGVVITFIDITAIKQLESELRDRSTEGKTR